MATEAKKFSGGVTKFQAGFAACAIATAAVLTPVAAQADTAPLPLAPVTDIFAAPMYGSLDLAPNITFRQICLAIGTDCDSVDGGTINGFTVISGLVRFTVNAIAFILRLGAYVTGAASAA